MCAPPNSRRLSHSETSALDGRCAMIHTAGRRSQQYGRSRGKLSHTPIKGWKLAIATPHFSKLPPLTSRIVRTSMRRRSSAVPREKVVAVAAYRWLPPASAALIKHVKGNYWIFDICEQKDRRREWNLSTGEIWSVKGKAPHWEVKFRKN